MTTTSSKWRPPAGNVTDRPDQLVRGGVLQDVATRPGLDGAEDDLVVVVDGEHDDLRGRPAPSLTSRGMTSSPCMPGIWRSSSTMSQSTELGKDDRLFAAGGLPDDLQVVAGADDALEPAPDHFVIVDDQYANRSFHRFPCSPGVPVSVVQRDISVTVVPRPGADSSDKRAPITVACSSIMAHPKCASFLVVDTSKPTPSSRTLSRADRACSCTRSPRA